MKEERERRRKERELKRRKERLEMKKKEREEKEREKREKEEKEKDKDKNMQDDKNGNFSTLKNDYNFRLRLKLKNSNKRDFPVKIVDKEGNKNPREKYFLTQSNFYSTYPKKDIRSKSYYLNKNNKNGNNDVGVRTSYDWRYNNNRYNNFGNGKSRTRQNIINFNPKNGGNFTDRKGGQINQKYNGDDNRVCVTVENSNPKYPHFRKIFSKQNSEISDKSLNKNADTGLEDNDDKFYEFNYKNYRNRMLISKGKNKKKDLTSFLFFDPLNPYLPNWPNSFLKIGFNAGFRSNELHEGVPVLRIQKLKPKVVLPPIYKIKYNQFSENKNFNYDDDEDLVCSKVAKKLFSKTSNEFYSNKSKNNNINSNRSNGNSQYQKLISFDHNNS